MSIHVGAACSTGYLWSDDDAIVRSGASISRTGYFEVVQETGRIKDGKVEEFQVRVKIGFKIER